MSNLWERFDGIADKESVEEAKNQFTPVDEGIYDVVLEELAPAESKNGLPMLKGKFRMLQGNRILFYNQNLQNLNYPNLTAKNIAEALTFVSGIAGEEIEYNGLSDFADTILKLPMGTSHKVKVSYAQNDTERKFTKLEVIEKVDGIDMDGYEDGDIPF